MNFSETNGVICDANGNLLFYTNGVYIANANDDSMQNGDGLNPSPFTTDHSFGGLTIPQANLVIPYPGDSTKYYLFHTTSDDRGSTYAAYFLYYSLIDMTLDNGLGAVVQKNVVVSNDTVIPGRLIGCKHANGRDWWIVQHEYKTGFINKFLVTPYGIDGPLKQDLLTLRDIYFGQGVFSQNGDKFAYYEPYGGLDILDFDRCTGDFSNQLHIDMNDSAGAGGVAFSQSGRFLYVPSTRYVYQFDMFSPDIEASKLTVAVWDTFYAPFQPFATVFYLAALAPDNKIYINCSNGTDAMHVINSPDSLGSSCDFCQNCIALPAFNHFTLPNHPNYFLGAATGSSCDTVHTEITNLTSSINRFLIFPNPVRDVLYLTQNKSDRITAIRLVNVLGQVNQVVFTSLKNDEYAMIDCSNLSTGMYVLEVVTTRGVISKKFFKE